VEQSKTTTGCIIGVSKNCNYNNSMKKSFVKENIIHSTIITQKIIPKPTKKAASVDTTP
jgi:hypothetical protein